jgi:quercetin dioxygenase-like cupin family protein
MSVRISHLLAFVGAAALLGCSDGSVMPTTPDVVGQQAPLANVVAATLPFTYRAPLEPYLINRMPEYMAQSRTTSDFVIQQSLFAPGPGAWHTHPGPSFVYVLQGQIKLTEFHGKEGCVDTPVYSVGQAYLEAGDHTHRAFVVSSEEAVLLVVRFNIPVGGPITMPADDPGC